MNYISVALLFPTLRKMGILFISASSPSTKVIPNSPAPADRGPPQTIIVPDKLNPDWCRFRTGGACCLAGDVLADEAGVTVLGVTDTSHTGPSYRPRGTPLSSASCKTQDPLVKAHSQRMPPWRPPDVGGTEACETQGRRVTQGQMSA